MSSVNDMALMRVIPGLNASDLRIDQHTAAHRLDPPPRGRGEELAQSLRGKTEMQIAIAHEPAVNAQERGRRAALERHVHERHRFETPENVDHARAHALAAQVLVRAHGVERIDVVLVETQRAPERRPAREEIARVQSRRSAEIGHQAEGRWQRLVRDLDGSAAGDERDHLFRLPRDGAVAAEPRQERREIAVFAVHEVRADVDHIAARAVGHAVRAASEPAAAFEDERLHALFRKGDRAGEPREPTAHDQGIGVVYH